MSLLRVSGYAKPLTLNIFIYINHLRTFWIAMFFSGSNVNLLWLEARHCSQYLHNHSQWASLWMKIIRTIEKHTKLHNLKTSSISTYEVFFDLIFNFNPKLLQLCKSSKHFSKNTISSFSMQNTFIYTSNQN